jgi:WD40 repeat protein
MPLLGTTTSSSPGGAILLNAGGPVWSLDWLEAADLDAQYLALAAYQTRAEEHNVGRCYQGPNAVQVWRWAAPESPSLVAGLTHEGGFVLDLRWCPHSYCAPTRRLGLLAACLGDGRLVVWSVPLPTLPPSATQLWRLAPVLQLSAQPHLFTAVRWAPASAECALLFTGRSDGAVHAWNLREAHDATPSVCPSPVFAANQHQQAVRSISVSPLSTMTEARFASVGLDGRLLVWYLNEPFRYMHSCSLSVPVRDLHWFGATQVAVAPEEAALGVVTSDRDEHARFWQRTRHRPYAWRCGQTRRSSPVPRMTARSA